MPAHGAGTGKDAHAWVDALQDGADELEVRFHPSLPPASQRLLNDLGVRVVFDEHAPTRCDHQHQDQSRIGAAHKHTREATR